MKSPEMDSRVDFFSDHFGCCLKCKKPMDRFVNIGRGHWAVCEKDKTKWFIGSNLFSSWRHETDDDWRRNFEQIKDFEEVEPWYRASAEPDDPAESGQRLRTIRLLVDGFLTERDETGYPQGDKCEVEFPAMGQCLGLCWEHVERGLARLGMAPLYDADRVGIAEIIYEQLRHNDSKVRQFVRSLAHDCVDYVQARNMGFKSSGDKDRPAYAPTPLPTPQDGFDDE